MKDPSHTCVIVGSGPIDHEGLSFCRSWIEKSDLRLCADGGASVYRSLDITPDYLVGDLDSITLEDMQWMQDRGVRTMVYPKSKDYLDTELCMHVIRHLDIFKMVFLGLWGDQPDHSLAALNLLSLAHDLSIEATIQMPRYEIGLLTGPVSKSIHTLPDSRWSLICLSECCQDVELDGFEYSLQSETLTFSQPKGVSNRAIKEDVRISFSSGRMIYVHWKKESEAQS